MTKLLKCEIYGVEYTVIFTDDYHDFHTNEFLFGQTVYDTLTIYIRDNLCEEAKKRTLVHEIVHALLNAQGGINRRTFELEDLCEFVAWNSEYINHIADEVWKEYMKRKLK